MTRKEKIIRLTELQDQYDSLNKKYNSNFIDAEPELHDDICEEHKKLFCQVYPNRNYWGML